MYVTFGFSTTRKHHLLSSLIRKVEKTPFSHVYLKFHSDSLDRDLIYQASHFDINFMNTKLFDEKNVVIEEFDIPCTADERRAMVQYAVDKVGDPYAAMQLVGIGLVRLVRAWFGLKIHNPFSDGEKRQICMELGGRCLRFLGVEVDETLLEEGKMSQIYDLIKKTYEDRTNVKF